MHLLCIFTIYRYVYQCQVDMDVSHDRTETRCHRFFHDTPNRVIRTRAGHPKINRLYI